MQHRSSHQFRKAIDTYYAALATYRSQDVTHEQATRLAFSTLLDTFSKTVVSDAPVVAGSHSPYTVRFFTDTHKGYPRYRHHR